MISWGLISHSDALDSKIDLKQGGKNRTQFLIAPHRRHHLLFGTNGYLMTMAGLEPVGGGRLHEAHGGMYGPSQTKALEQWSPTLGFHMFLDFSSQKS